MSEQVFLGGCPIVRPEGIYFGGQRVIRLGLGDAGDLFAYRQMWEPFIAAHLEIWRDVNSRFEASEFSKKCPPGIFTNAQIPKDLDTTSQSFCAALALSRIETSSTNQDGILPRWNAWQNKSSSQIIAGAPDMLKWLQSVVLQVGGPDKDKLLQISKAWEIPVRLPDLPSFSLQQEIIARTEGAYTTTKGILQLLGYGASESLQMAGSVGQAIADGLTDTAHDIPKTVHWVAIAAGVTAVIVGGVLIAYYVPRRASPSPEYRRLPA